MKNLFSSPTEIPDFQNFSKELKIVQQQLIDLRIDLSRIKKDTKRCVAGIAILVATPEPDLESELDVTEDISGSD